MAVDEIQTPYLTTLQTPSNCFSTHFFRRFHSTHQMSNASSFEVVCLRDMNKGVNRLKGRV